MRQLVHGGDRSKLGVGRADIGREPGQQLVDDFGLPVQVQARPVIGEQPGGQTKITRGLGVPDRLRRVPVRAEPGRGGQVQLASLRGRGSAQLQRQQPGEHLVVAEPGPGGVHGHHKCVGLLQVLQDPFPAVVAGQQIGQLTVDPFEDRGPQKQPPHLFVLPVEHLGQQVFGHRPLAARELGREPLRVRVPVQ